MRGKTDLVKGRIKKAPRVVIGIDELRTGGKIDQAVGKEGKLPKRPSTRSCKPRQKCESQLATIRERSSVCLWAITILS